MPANVSRQQRGSGRICLAGDTPAAGAAQRAEAGAPCTYATAAPRSPLIGTRPPPRRSVTSGGGRFGFHLSIFRVAGRVRPLCSSMGDGGYRAIAPPIPSWGNVPPACFRKHMNRTRLWKPSRWAPRMAPPSPGAESRDKNRRMLTGPAKGPLEKIVLAWDEKTSCRGYSL